MLSYIESFYKYWASLPVWLPVIYLIFILPQMWFGVIRTSKVHYSLIMSAPNNLIFAHGRIISGLRSSHQPYIVNLANGKKLSLYCDPTTPTYNNCLELDRINIQNISNMPLTFGYIVEPELSGLGTINIVMSISGGADEILTYEASKDDLVKNTKVFNKTRGNALTMMPVLFAIVIIMTLLIGLLCSISAHIIKVKKQ